MTIRIFYAAAGEADLIEAHRHWRAGTHDPSEVSITFSSQIESFCEGIGAEALFISTHPNRRRFDDGRFRFEHRPKSRTLVHFHLQEVARGLLLLWRALRFRADVAILDSGCTHYFMMALFRLAGIKVLPVLHNTLWPANFPPRKPIRRLVLWLDRLFWQRGPMAVIAVSPEGERQLETLRDRKTYPVFQTRAQFHPDYFAAIPPPPPHGSRPFTVMFIGRVDIIKGVLDIPLMARMVEDEHPGLVRWIVCGSGPALEELRKLHETLDLGEVVDIKGWTTLEEIVRVYARSHASIVPTTSLFPEGLAMSAAEAILAGRPLVTNPVVPALELLRPAAIAAETNDPASHARAVVRLALDRDLYERLRTACPPLAYPFYDRRQSLEAVLHRAMEPEFKGETTALPSA